MKYFKTTVVINILSEEKPFTPDPDTQSLLQDIDYAIQEGECSGEINITKTTKLNAKEVVKELQKQGSDPEFFGLNENGEQIEF